jgi:hypothetical protein
MKTIKCAIATLLLLQIAFAGSALAQSHNGKSSTNFLIDSTKPYVYLEVDHIGPRRPMSEDEPNVGIWLRWHNNCTVPITVFTFGVGNPPLAFVPQPSEDEEVGVYYGVVANPAPAGGAGGEGFPPGPTPTDVAAELWGNSPPMTSPKPKPTAASVQKSEDSKMPEGYWLDVGSLTTIYPGKSIYFSLPRNSVSPKWHVQIAFKFDLRIQSPNVHNYITLYENDLPTSARPK